jgi:fermentation-respiration switch protein FrsA (DUF1100 family)
MTRLTIGLFLIGFSIIGCSSLLYYPTKYVYVDADQLPIKPEQRRFLISEQVQNSNPAKTSGEKVYDNGGYDKKAYDIVTWRFRNGKTVPPKALFIQFHGNGQNLTAHFATLYWLLKEGYDVVIFDYPGYGLSTGEPSPKNTVLVGQKIIEIIREENPNTPLVIYGESLGGAVAIKSVLQLKDRKNIKAVVADSTFLSYQKTARRFLSRHWLTWIFQPLAWVLISDSWAPGDSVSELSPIPLLVVHGTDDQIIDFDLGEEVFSKASEPKQFIKIENSGHIQTYIGPKKTETRKQFLDYLKSLNI